MKRNLTIVFIIFCLFATNLVFPKEVKVLPNIPDALFNAATAASAGDVLILADGGIYPNSSPINNIVLLTIKTADGAVNKAKLVFSTGGPYIGNMFQADASLTLKNLVCNGQRGATPYGGRWINRSSLSKVSKIEVDSCEVSRFQFLSTGGDLDTLIVKNCLFNGNIVRAGSWGGTWDFQSDAVKYVKIQNNTFMFCTFGPFLGTGWNNYVPLEKQIHTVIIDHNTMYNITGAHGPTTMMARVENLQMTNNLYINGTFRPNEFFSDQYHYFLIDTLGSSTMYFPPYGPKGMWLFSISMVDSANTKIDMRNNNISFTSDVLASWAEKGLEKPWIYTNETKMAIIDTNAAYFEEELAFNNAPAVPMFAIDSVAEHCAIGNADTVAYKGTSPYFGWDWWDGVDPLFDLRSRYNMDMRYNRDAKSFTAGDGGFPLGDLNWWPGWDPDAIKNHETGFVSQFDLAQNYPNPFNPSTTIKYTLQKAADVKLTIYNTVGQEVKTLVAGRMNAGSHSIIWDGSNAAGEQVVSGIYCYRLKVGEYYKSKKMLLVK